MSPVLDSFRKVVNNQLNSGIVGLFSQKGREAGEGDSFSSYVRERKNERK